MINKNLKKAPLIFNDNIVVIGFASPNTSSEATEYLQAYQNNPTILNIQINKDNQVINFLPLNANPIPNVSDRRFFWKDINLSLLSNFFELDQTMEFPVIGERQGQEISYNWILNDNITGDFDDNDEEFPTFFQGYVEEDLQEGSIWLTESSETLALSKINPTSTPVSFNGKGWLSFITENNVTNIIIEHKGEIYISDETINYSGDFTNLMVGYTPTQLNSLNWLRVGESSLISDDLDIVCTDSYTLFLVTDEFPLSCICDTNLIQQLEDDLKDAEEICNDNDFLNVFETDLFNWYDTARGSFPDLSNYDFQTLKDFLEDYVENNNTIDRLAVESAVDGFFGSNVFTNMFDFDISIWSALENILFQLQDDLIIQRNACGSIPTIQSQLNSAILACENFRECVKSSLESNQISAKYNFRSVDSDSINFHTKQGSIINFPIAKREDFNINDNREAYDSTNISVAFEGFNPIDGGTFNTNQDYTKPNTVTYLDSNETITVKSIVLSDKEAIAFNRVIADSYLIYKDNRAVEVLAANRRVRGNKANFFDLNLRIK